MEFGGRPAIRTNRGLPPLPLFWCKVFDLEALGLDFGYTVLQELCIPDGRFGGLEDAGKDRLEHASGLGWWCAGGLAVWGDVAV